jgi:AcrR family transcriptional regulator
MSADTRQRLLDGTLVAMREHGVAGISARTIAAAAGVNQALIFYHYGSVQGLLLAVLDRVSERRMAAYGPAFERAQTIPELAILARTIYAEDLENGYVTVLGEMVAGGASDPDLGAEVVLRLQPWIEMVRLKVDQLFAGSPFESVIPSRDIAFAIVALYLGIDMLSHLDGDHAPAESLLDLGVRLAPLLGMVVPSAAGEER